MKSRYSTILLQLRYVENLHIFKIKYIKKGVGMIISNLKEDVLNTISDQSLKVLLIFGDNLSYRNIVIYKNGNPIVKDDLISSFLNISISKWYVIKKELLNKKLIMFNNKTIYLNPIFIKHYNFVWDICIFNIFDDYLQTNLHKFEYIKIKSDFYEINHELSVSSLDDIINNLSGIYKLYKNNEIVYVGKSKNIKTRIVHHLKEKDIDEFDFTLMNNPSDKNLYELYYIDKYKPLYNRDCIESSISNIELKDLIFSNKIKITP